jgi:hypothetical protein
MPLFRRPDGDLVKDVAPVRGIMPYVMRGRNESAVLHEQVCDITKTRLWLRSFNRAREREQPATLFHLFLWCCARGLWERPELNRFVSGKRLYQRKGVYLSFAAKKELDDAAPLVTVKLPFPKDEPFAACVERIVAHIKEGRGPGGRMVDKELALAMKLPGFLLSFVMGALRWLDRYNLMPRFMIESDPLYTSLFVANLGSIGLDRTFHHLYEAGTASLFAVLGTPRREATTGRDGLTKLRDVLEVRWSLDERVSDGFYAGASLAWAKRIFEDPERHLGPAEEVAAGGAARPAEPAVAEAELADGRAPGRAGLG